MQKTSSLFLRNLTQIDYAIICPDRLVPIGGSLQLNMIVSGKVDSTEQVVVDFSTIKKDIKQIVDAQHDGFDHKLWIPIDSSDIKIEEDGGEIQIITSDFEYQCPTNATQFICMQDPTEHINYHINRALAMKYPDVNIETTATLTNEMWCPEHLRDSMITFSYVHGLKNSTSWGCQNMNHGHLSWIAFEDKYDQPVILSPSIKAGIHDYINNALFIWEDNIKDHYEDHISIEYTTPRGVFYSKYDSDNNKIVLIDSDTTVENLVDWFVNEFKEDLNKSGVKRVYMSEGLAKGSVAEVP